MEIYLVNIHVKLESISEFIQATEDNASNSLKEPGVIRFDFIQQKDDPTRFMLIEVYRTQEDPVKHKQTAHYLRWRDRVTDMMAEPRIGTQYQNLYPPESDWLK